MTIQISLNYCINNLEWITFLIDDIFYLFIFCLGK